jgi:hypothetical protein
VSSISTKAQVWYTDFIIGILIFTVAIIIYFVYTTNLSKDEVGLLNDLTSEAKFVSSSLASEGYPSEWDNATVKRIGLTDNSQKIDEDKLRNFADLSYNRTKKLLGTVYDFLVFFEDTNSTILNIGGFCGKGSPAVNISFDIRTAYYYDGEEFLKDFMMEQFNADIYSSSDPENDFDALAANLTNYGLVVVEHPLLSTSDFTEHKSEFEDYVSIGGLLMLSGEIVSAQGKDMLGVEFYKKSGQSISDRNATVNQSDEYLAFEVGRSIVFAQAYYTINTSDAQNYKTLVVFNEDDNTAVSKWSYGNGTSYYFSDFDATYFGGNFIREVEDGTKGWVGGRCIINMSNANINNLAKTSRFLTYNKGNKLNIAKMVLYLWS